MTTIVTYFAGKCHRIDLIFLSYQFEANVIRKAQLIYHPDR
jgi:hypothetical protein